MFGKPICPECGDGFVKLDRTGTKISVENPDTGKRQEDVNHQGPMVVAPEDHVMVVHRGHGKAVIINPGQVISLCEGDVVRVLREQKE